MSQPSSQDPPVPEFEPNQIAVALEHLGLLVHALGPNGLDIAHTVAKTSDALGLALVQLESADGAAETLIPEAEAAATSSYAQPAAEGPSLDQVLWALRTVFKGRYAGWAPTLGKNRYVGHVHGSYAVMHGGDGDPKPHANPTADRRAMGPGAGIRVGVLDTAFYPQPWLAGGWTARFSDILGPDAAPTVADGHATFVTGLILSQAPGAAVEVRRVLDADGQRDSWEVAEEIVRFGQSGLDVLNLSLSCHTEDNDSPMVLATAIDRLDPKLLVVAAAGNYIAVDPNKPDDAARNRPTWPAALDDVIAVGAATAHGRLASFSPDAPWIDVLARGEGVVSTYLHQTFTKDDGTEVSYDDWASWCGTSFATALFSGAVAAGAVRNQISAAQSAQNILDTLRDDESLAFAGSTHAKCVPLRIWK